MTVNFVLIWIKSFLNVIFVGIWMLCKCVCMWSILNVSLNVTGILWNVILWYFDMNRWALVVVGSDQVKYFVDDFLLNRNEDWPKDLLVLNFDLISHSTPSPPSMPFRWCQIIEILFLSSSRMSHEFIVFKHTKH